MLKNIFNKLSPDSEPISRRYRFLELLEEENERQDKDWVRIARLEKGAGEEKVGNKKRFVSSLGRSVRYRQVRLEVFSVNK